MKRFYKLLLVQLPTWWYCLISGLKYHRTWQLRGGGDYQERLACPYAVAPAQWLRNVSISRHESYSIEGRALRIKNFIEEKLN